MIKDAEIPVVYCIATKSAWVIKTCPFCGKQHSHTKSEGHRVAHCGNFYPDSELQAISDRGYYLKLAYAQRPRFTRKKSRRMCPECGSNTWNGFKCFECTYDEGE